MCRAVRVAKSPKDANATHDEAGARRRSRFLTAKLRSFFENTILIFEWLVRSTHFRRILDSLTVIIGLPGYDMLERLSNQVSLEMKAHIHCRKDMVLAWREVEEACQIFESLTKNSN